MATDVVVAGHRDHGAQHALPFPRGHGDAHARHAIGQRGERIHLAPHRGALLEADGHRHRAAGALARAHGHGDVDGVSGRGALASGAPAARAKSTLVTRGSRRLMARSLPALAA